VSAEQAVLRTAVPGDLPALIALDRAAGMPPMTAAYYRALLLKVSEHQACVPVATADGVPVAFSVTTWLMDEASLLDVAVAPEWRRRGLGQRLLQQTLTRLRESGLQRWLLEVRSSNRPAQHLYRSLGFERDGLRPNYYPARPGQPAEAAVLMSMLLE
jgi:ribosomal-protein-alanine N-acetyltransferase